MYTYIEDESSVSKETTAERYASAVERRSRHKAGHSRPAETRGFITTTAKMQKQPQCDLVSRNDSERYAVCDDLRGS